MREHERSATSYRSDPMELLLRYQAAIKRDFYRALEHYQRLKQAD